MSLWLAIIVSVIILLIVLRILFPSAFKGFHILAEGIMNKLVIDTAKTPEGTELIYTQVIREYEIKYANADNILKDYSGQLAIEEDMLRQYKSKLKRIESDCEALVKSGKFEEAENLSIEREELLIDINTSKEKIEILRPKVEEATFLSEQLQKKLRSAKLRKKQVVSELKLNNESQKMYDDFDDLKNTTELDRLLEAVNEGHQESRARAIGAKTVNDNRISTKVEKAKSQARQLQTSSYVEDLKKKYNKS